MKVQIYLTRRNLESLLAKLDKNLLQPNTSAVTIVKRDTEHKTYPQTGSNEVYVTGVENEDYYAERVPGIMLEDFGK